VKNREIRRCYLGRIFYSARPPNSINVVIIRMEIYEQFSFITTNDRDYDLAGRSRRPDCPPISRFHASGIEKEREAFRASG